MIDQIVEFARVLDWLNCPELSDKNQVIKYPYQTTPNHYADYIARAFTKWRLQERWSIAEMAKNYRGPENKKNDDTLTLLLQAKLVETLEIMVDRFEPTLYRGYEEVSLEHEWVRYILNSHFISTNKGKLTLIRVWPYFSGQGIKQHLAFDYVWSFLIRAYSFDGLKIDKVGYLMPLHPRNNQVRLHTQEAPKPNNLVYGLFESYLSAEGDFYRLSYCSDCPMHRDCSIINNNSPQVKEDDPLEKALPLFSPRTRA